MSAEQAANIIATVSPEGMVGRLVELTRENADLKAKLSQVEAESSERLQALARLETERFELSTANLKLGLDKQRIEADAAVMREALEKLRDGDFPGTPINCLSEAMRLIEDALKGETK